MTRLLRVLAVVVTAGALVSITAPLAFGDNPGKPFGPYGTCPNSQYGSPVSASADPTSDLNDDGLICQKTVAGGTSVEGPQYIDNTAHNQHP